MGKMKDTLPTVGQQLLPTPPVTFLQQLSKLAQPVTKADTTKVDPVTSMREKFAVNADETLKGIKAAADSGKFFKKLPNGKFLVWFKNANSVMCLNGSTHFQVDNTAGVVKLVEAAKSAAAAGELDEALKTTQRKRPAKKAETQAA